MTPPRKPWRHCNRDGCEARLIFATHNHRTLPYEYDDRAPFSLEAAGCHVLVGGEAWLPLELIEDFQTRLGIPESKARELVTGYPFHRPHRCEPTTSTTQPTSTEDNAA